MVMPDLPSHLHPLFFGIQMWHLSSLPYIFTPQYLHVCKEKICANPLTITY